MMLEDTAAGGSRDSKREFQKQEIRIGAKILLNKYPKAGDDLLRSTYRQRAGRTEGGRRKD